MAKYRKKSIVADAEQFFPHKLEYLIGVFMVPHPDTKAPVYFIQTLEGDMRLEVGDWVITGVKGEKYICKDDIFKMTYEKVED